MTKSVRVELVKAIVATYHQGKRSMRGEGRTTCAYRGVDGCKCILGHMIDDAAYTPDLEGFDASSVRVRQALKDSGFDQLDLEEHVELLTEIQSAHDRSFGSNFRETLLENVKWESGIIHREVLAIIEPQPTEANTCAI